MELMDLVVIGVIILCIAGLIVAYIYRGLIRPHRMDSVKELMEKGRNADAIVAVTSALKKNPDDIELHYLLGLCNFNLKNYEVALQEFLMVVSNSKFVGTSTEIEVRDKIADIYMMLGQVDEAQKEYAFLTQKAPTNPEYFYKVGKIFFEKNNKEQAFSFLDKALKLGKIDSNVYYMMGKIYFDSSRTGEALNMFTNCVKIEPKHHEAHFFMGMILKATGSFGKATQEFDIAETSKDPFFKAKAAYQKALCKMEVGELTGAKIDLERGIRFASTDTNIVVACRYVLGLIYEQERKIMDAIDQWEKVHQLKPSYQDVQKKLETYADLRGDDKIKDLLTSTTSTFESMAQDMIRNLGYDILESKIESSDLVYLTGVEKSSKFRDVTGGKIFGAVSRSNDDIEEKDIIFALDSMKGIHGVKAIYISTAKFTPQAMRYSENRPIQLIDRDGINSAFRNDG